jgi:hypothetical protein
MVDSKVLLQRKDEKSGNKSSQQIRLFEVVPSDHLSYYIEIPVWLAKSLYKHIGFLHVLLVSTTDVELESVAHVTWMCKVSLFWASCL